MRAAEQNELSGADRLLCDSVGGSRLPITTKRAVILADYCRCDVPEFFQLFGIESRSTNGTRQWQFASEYVTKDYFLRPSKPSLCPQCLVESRHLRGQWEITMYIACPLHNAMLLERCPACKKSISPHRAKLDMCNCGFFFCEVYPDQAPPEAIWLAMLIDKFISGRLVVPRAAERVASANTTERVAALSLDALFKTLWFLGVYLDEDVPPAVGRIRPDAAAVLKIIRTAIAMLDGWPRSFLETLATRAYRLDPARSRHPEKALMPLRNYLDHELGDDGHAFIHAAYDRFIRDAWSNRAYRTFRKSRITQLELF